MPGCLLLDVRMPDINGLEIQERMNASGCKMPIIFISAHQDPEVYRKSLDAGAAAFLQKPFDDQLLVETIRSALNKYENHQTEGNSEL